jgi:pyrroloquinoline quinone biosynthesis protein B
MISRAIASPLLIVAALGLAGCGSSARVASDGPRLRILGTIQDGGLPQAACRCRNCEAARRNTAARRCVASAAIIIPGAKDRSTVYLVDCSPDLVHQLDLLRDVRPADARRPVEGALLTHAHIGHYLGLAFFGFEAVSANKLNIHATVRMSDFLRTNGPWSQLVQRENILLHEVVPDETFNLPVGDAESTTVSVTPILVPHRDEYSDTVAYVIRRHVPTLSRRPPAVLYLPDTEPWRTWREPLPVLIEREGVTTLLLDGTFFAATDLPDRDVSRIGHPLMVDSMDLLEPLVRPGRLTVYFFHLNHSNPAIDPHSDAARLIRSRGFHVACEGMEIPL